jgi:type VI secretion system protein ImpF
MAFDDGNPVGPTLSILDRLTDLEPNSKKERPLNPWETLRELKASVCRDLAGLLNTRRAEEDFDPGYKEASNSLLTFGVVDFTSYNLKHTIEQERVRRSIERAIRLFEPRLSQVAVTLEEPDPLRPMLHFQIAAVLHTQSATEDVLFDATLNRDSRRVSVSGANS